MSVRRSLAWMMMSQGGFFVLQFGGAVVLARLLTPYDMGVYAAAAAIIGILGILQAFGITLFIIREPEIDRDLLASAFTVNTALAALLAIAVVGLSAFGGAFLREPGVERVMRVLALLPMIGILEFLPATNLERSADFRAIAAVNLLRAAVGTSVTIALAFAGFSYMSIAWGSIAGAVAGAAGFMIAGRQHVSFRVGLTAWRRILRFGMQQLAIQGVNAVSVRAAEFLLGRLLGLSALGLYGRASNLNNMIWSNIHMVVGRVVLVDLADQRRRGIDLRGAYLRTVEVITALLWPCFAGLAILAGPLIDIVYGDAWVGAAPPLAALAVSAILLVSITMTWELFVVCHETDRQARFEFVRSGVGLALFVAGCFLSLAAAAAARIGEALFSIFLYRPHIERMTSTRRADYMPIYRRSAILTAAACGPALVLMIAYSWSPHVPAALVGAVVAGGLAAWLGAVRLMDHALAGEIHRLVTMGRKMAGLASNATATRSEEGV
jgi:O-antigen/teichoic acid export membrane protein